ncbi:MAG: diphthine--ammonia ligase [Flavobacteriaceae bacterium]
MKGNAAVLWTGGKDCALAFYKAQLEGYSITHLVTFTPENPNFVAHSLLLMEEQVESIGLPHIKVLVKNPMKESYEDGIARLKNQYDIETLITGDIDEIENHGNWIEERSQKSGMHVHNPLWKKNRKELLNELIHLNFNVIFTLVKKPFFNTNWVGRKIDLEVIRKLEKLEVDLCGENGEYHTMVLNAPFFQKEISTQSFQVKEEDQYYYLKHNNSSSD